jgi:DNA helicase-2/ATP-dependent DNA helicase PcrA
MSYRYGPQLAYAMADFKQKTVSSSLARPTDIRQAFYDAGTDAGAAPLVRALLDWQGDGHALADCAILVRSRNQSVAIENALMQAQIAYRTQEMPSYLQREEILFLRGMLAIALKNLHTVKSDAVRKAIVEALAIFAEVELSAQEMDEAKKIIARDPDTLAYFFTGQLQRAGADGDGLSVSGCIAATVAYAENVPAETPAAVVLREICSLINLPAAAKRIYVHPYDAQVVAKTVAGFIAAAENSGKNLREFSEWLGAAEQFAGAKPDRNTVLLESVGNSKGKEFEHVILPFMEAGAFPNALCRLAEEENLFYVGATRARSRLTLLAPLAEERRSPFIGRMTSPGSAARANAALAENAARPAAAPGRHDLKVPFAEKDSVKALGAEWDLARRVWYVKAGADLGPFMRWLRT